MKWWGHPNSVKGVKLVKKITDLELYRRKNQRTTKEYIEKGPATQNAVCRGGLRSLSAAECYILSRLF